MKIRIEAPTTAELGRAEALLRVVFDADEASPDYRNRKRNQGDERARDSRRYLNNVQPADGFTVYAVVFGNYEPAETHSLWATKELAEARCDQLDGHMWRVVPWGIGTTLPAPAPRFEPCTMRCSSSGCGAEVTTKESDDFGPVVQLGELGWRHGAGGWHCPGPHETVGP